MLPPRKPKKRSTIHWLAACCWLLQPALAARADEPPPKAANARDETFTAYTFEDEQVVGDTAQPTGEVLTVRPRPKRTSLIRARDQFVRELLKSVEAL